MIWIEKNIFFFSFLMIKNWMQHYVSVPKKNNKLQYQNSMIKTTIYSQILKTKRNQWSIQR